MSRLVFLYNNIFEYEYAYVRIMYKCFQKTKKNLVRAGLGIIIIIYEVIFIFWIRCSGRRNNLFSGFGDTRKNKTNSCARVEDWTKEIWGLWRGTESLACLKRRDGEGGRGPSSWRWVQLVELGRQRLGRVEIEKGRRPSSAGLYSRASVSRGLALGGRSASWKKRC